MKEFAESVDGFFQYSIKRFSTGVPDNTILFFALIDLTAFDCFVNGFLILCASSITIKNHFLRLIFL